MALTQFAFIRVPVESIPAIVDTLRSTGYLGTANDVEIFSRDYTNPEANEKRLAWIERAREQVGQEGEIEFDSDATISHSDDNGEYVLGWVWVDGEPDEE